jgi:hypothetical protein
MSEDAAALYSLVSLAISFAVAAVAIASLWRIFTKAGKPGWAAIIPIYNTVVMLQIVGRPLWFILLAFVPFVNLIVAVIICLDLARSFGKSAMFGVGLIFLSIIFLPILAFGDARYVGPAARQAASAPAAA